MRTHLYFWIAGIVFVCAGQSASAGEEVAAHIAQIKAVGKQGKGNVEAAKAWRELVKQGPNVLPELLAALDDATPIAANWLRSAVDAVAERSLAAGKLTAAPLEAFVKDTRHVGSARRLAFEWLAKVDPSTRTRLLPGMLNDPGAELRREAVEVELKKAQAVFEKEEAAALPVYRKLLGVARDRDQVRLVAERLDKLGVPVDLTAHLGFITHWSLAGPFDNAKGIGFRTAYPPEMGIDLKAEYKGKDDKLVRWIEHAVETPKGTVELGKLAVVDLNKLFQGAKADSPERMREAIVFAYAAIESKQQRAVDIRAASNNAIRIWLNGKEIFFREEYHHGMETDQHIGKGTLKAGRNDLLLKICQNNQDEAWARLWSFQLRVCDALGAAVPVQVVKDR